MSLIKNIIDRKAKIKALECEIDTLKGELEHLYFARFNGEKVWKCSSTMLAYRIRKVLYSQDVKLRGNKRLLQLEDKKQQLLELVEELREYVPHNETENTSKIG